MTVNCRTLFEKIDELQAHYLDVLEELCNIESCTDDKVGVDEAGRYLADFARAKGWRVEVYPQRVSGDVVVITMNPDAKGAPISLSGHLDTVYPRGTYPTPAVRRDDVYMHGPGVVDCKGGVVGGLLAMDALEQCGFVARPVLLLLQTDEEKGSTPSGQDTIHYICERAMGSAAFLNLEGHTAPNVPITRKGILRYRIDVRGKASHSANCHQGVNAIVEAAHEIIELEKMKQVEGGLTCNCGMIEGGTAPNTVAEECSFTADIRFANAEQLAQARVTVARVTENVTLPGSVSTATQISFRPAMEKVERNLHLLDKINEIYEANGMPRLVGVHTKGGSDAAYVTLAGIPCVDSIGTEGEEIHSIRERMELASLARCAKRVAAAVWCMEDEK